MALGCLGLTGLTDLTAQRFGVDPDGTRVYRSGDQPGAGAASRLPALSSRL